MENKDLNKIIRSIIFDEECCTDGYGFFDEEFLMGRFNLNEDEVAELISVLEKTGTN
jgi:hypothetical protein